MKRHTRATPAGIPRSRANLTRRERLEATWLDGVSIGSSTMATKAFMALSDKQFSLLIDRVFGPIAGPSQPAIPPQTPEDSQ